ncbi:hypothetical protein [Halalkalibacter akibai]|uniref:hypothetical protein n=1 Tax=Halalkalibacter akibai TaxID=1411 RepID=UPI000550E606|nr:hypothetical protein [Halalkalibacter akibai]
MISASTWFDPIVLEVVVIPIAIILGIISAWFSRRVVVGPIVYIGVFTLFYVLVYVYFYSANSAQFFAIHFHNVESYLLELLLIGITWIVSWCFLSARRNRLA